MESSPIVTAVVAPVTTAVVVPVTGQPSGGTLVNNAFELTVETTAADESFLLPMQSVTSIDVDWGDGTVDTGITTDNPTHTYATAGTHSISVTGTAGTVRFDGSGSEGKLRTVTNLGALGWTTFANAFRDCSSMTSFDAGDCDTSNVTNMGTTFQECTSLTSLDVSNFNTSNVTNISGMFFGCTSLTSLDVSNFDTSNVTNMRVMFYLCSSLTDIIGVENFDISQVTEFNASWGGPFMSGFALPTSRYDALLVNWEAQTVQPNLAVGFGNSKYTAGGAAEAARTSLVTGDGWTITDGGGTVNNAFELTVETTAANESFLLPMQSVTSIDIDWGDGTVDTGITTDNPTHTYATAGTHAISVTGTAGTVRFFGSGSEGKLRTVTNLGALGWTNLSSSFRNCSSMTSFDAGDCDTSNVTNMEAMFAGCSSLTSLDLSNFNTSNVTKMIVMFFRCSSLASLDLSNFNTSNVPNMTEMFRDCSSLTSLDLSNFDTSNVTNMQVMFLNCSSLTDIIGVENFNISQVTAFNASWGGGFMTGFALPTSRYDALLVNWEAQTVQPNLPVTFGTSQYTAGGAAEAARTSLVTGDGWTITDGGAVTNDAFELTVETTAANETFLLPMLGVTSIDVDWGDGTVDTGITSNNPTHEYATAGTHSISVTGSATSVQFDGSASESKLRTVTNLGALGWTDLSNSFGDCSNMTSFVCGDCDTSSVTSMSQMFIRCSAATTIDVSTMACSASIAAMFRSCLAVTTLDVAHFDTSSQTGMARTFQDCSSLQNLDIDGWDVTSLTAAADFLNGANNALTTAQYDAVLIAWAAQAVQSNVTIHFGDAQYTAGGAAESARTTLVSTYGWTITDGGAA